MNKKHTLLKMCAAFAIAAFFAVGCSDDSSTGAGGGIDHGDSIDIPIPCTSEGSGKAESSSSAGKVESSTTTKAEGTSAENPKSSAAPESSAAPKSSDTPERSSSANVAASSAEESAEDWRDYCLEVVNAKRATEDLPPLKRANAEREKCVYEQAAKDMVAGKGHANFGDCGESAQNTGPNVNPKWYKTEKAIVDNYVNMMWDDEKALVTSGERDPNKDSDYSYIGHYLNMKNTRYTSLACGVAYSEDGSKAWFNMNFY